MKKLNKLLSSGLFIFAIASILNHTVGLPDAIYGFSIGIAIALELLGIYTMNHDIKKFKNFKMNLLKKFTSK